MKQKHKKTNVQGLSTKHNSAITTAAKQVDFSNINVKLTLLN